MEVDEVIARNLFGKARATLTQHATLAVEKDLGGHLDGFNKGALDIDEAAFAVAVVQ